MKNYMLIKINPKIKIVIPAVLALILGWINIASAIPAIYQRCEPNLECIIGEYVFNDDGYTATTTDNFCQITITNPSDVVTANNVNLLDKNDGWYYYATSTLSTPEGLYRSIICCDTSANKRCLDKTFILGTSFETLPEKIWGYTGAALDTTNNAITKVWSMATSTMTTAGSVGKHLVGNIDDKISNIASNVWNFATRKLTSREIGSGDYIAGESSSGMPTQYNIELVRKATFDFAGIADSGSTLTLVDSELDQPNNHWNNYELWMMSGLNMGEKKVIESFASTTHTITVTSAFTYANASGDKYVISHERKLVHAIWNWADRQLTSFGTLAADVWTAATRTLTSALLGGGGNLATESYINTATSTLTTTINTASSSIAAAVNTRASLSSQQAGWTVNLSDVGEVLTGKTYRAKLWVLNYESVPTYAYATSTVTIYDAARNKVVENVEMTKVSAGIYEYTYSVPSSATTGLWETVVSVQVESGKTIQRNDYWEVEASPAQVKINSISDNTVSSIVANVTISNEGSAGYEYQYEYCIVNSSDNQCGGGDDTAYGSAAKYIQAGESWITDLGLTVANIGAYWYKVYVYWGTEKSTATLQFDAVSGAVSPTCGDGSCNGSETCSTCPTDCGACSGGGGGGGGILAPTPTPAAVYTSTDFNKDGAVNSVDFSILLHFWKTKPPFKNSRVDINKDGQVNSVDFSILLYQWGKSTISKI